MILTPAAGLPFAVSSTCYDSRPMPCSPSSAASEHDFRRRATRTDRQMTFRELLKILSRTFL
jgi:hypothetical protein